MNQHFYKSEITRYENGHLESPKLPDNIQPPQKSLDDPWLVCALAIKRAKQGDFSLAPSLLQIYENTKKVALGHQCLSLLSRIGTTDCFLRIAEIVENESNLSNILDLCGVLTVRGELSYIPILLRKHLSNEGNREVDHLEDCIHELIGDQLFNFRLHNCIKLYDYEDAVMSCYEKMVNNFGSERVLVFYGARFGIVNLAEHILKSIQTSYISHGWKFRFESATGIDCRSWYKDKKPQALAITTIVENFLKNPESIRYEAGIRYFFGHRIP